MASPRAQVVLVALNLAFVWAAILEDFLQSSPEPSVDAGPPGLTSSSLTVSWETTANKAAPRVLGYELQYAVAGRGGGNDTAIWQTLEGNGKDTWVVTVQVDGFDRSTGKNHVVEDGWFTLALSREYPKPSPLPDLRLVTEAIAWDDTWSNLEYKVQRALRESRHPQYSSWTAAAVRCDETEQRGGDHWAGGCLFLEYGGYSWHIRLSPPEGDAMAALEDFPVLTVEKETITAKWSGEGDQVTSARYGFPRAAEGGNGSGGDGQGSQQTSSPSLDLIDPFFCQRGSCVRLLEGLAEATPYLVRLRAYNRNGFGPWRASSTDMSRGSRVATPGIRTDAAPATPTPKAPRLSSSTASSLTVFVDTTGESVAGSAGGKGAEVEAYEFEIQPYDEEEGGVRGDTGRWTPVIRGDAGNEDGRVPLGLSPLATATGLSPSTGYRFRVRLRDARGTGPVSGVSEVFTTGPGPPKPPPSPPAVDLESITADGMAAVWSSWAGAGDEDADKGGKYAFEAQWERLGTGYWQDANTASLDSDRREWRAAAEGLEPYSLHRFRVRAVNDVGAGEWSTTSDWARTNPSPMADLDLELVGEDARLPEDVPTSALLSVSGEGHTPGHASDPDYYHGVGVGGQVGLDGRGGHGGDGAAVIVSRVPGVPLPARASFFYSGSPELYAVPNHSGMTSVTLKLWGAGGGGVLTPTAGADIESGTSNATQVLGGGGGFLQVEVRVSPGEKLLVLVGGGGGASHGEAGGAGGFNGGQAGGSGSGGAAGGGGSTSVLRQQGRRLVAAAGGGGGAGNAERCCAGGGAGGGEWAEDGGTPALEAAVGTGGAGDCQSGWCSEPEVAAISYEGIENWITTGGGGGNRTHGGRQGNSDVFDWVDGGGGRQGGVSSPRGGDASMPIVYGGTSTRPATPGRSVTGGIGANGARGGGGGGGGFYGGGGGGSGEQGAGGGGGSSFADPGAVAFVEDPDGEWGRGGDVVRVTETGDSWVEVEWERSTETDPGEEPLFYEVEISEGYGSEDFRLAARVDAFDGSDAALRTRLSRGAVGAAPEALKTVLLGLSPGSDFDIRVTAISRLGPGRPSAALRFSTEGLPTNKWERVIPRPSRPERRGQGLPGPGLVGTESWDTDLASIQEENGFSDPPTELRQEAPSARSGHTLAVIAGKVYMFGGLSVSTRCSSAAAGSAALGDTPGGATTDCAGGDTFSAELWEFDPILSMWTEVVVGAGGAAPAARDGHTANVAGTKMIIFGGRGNGSDSGSQDGQGLRTAFFDDEWEIDLDPSRRVTVATNSSTAIREGGATFIPLVVEEAEENLGDTGGDVDMCISDLSVSVEIDHSCTGQLRLTLYGPGPPPGDARLPKNIPRGEPAVLFIGYNGTDGVSEYAAAAAAAGFETTATGGSSGGGGCGDGISASFTDSADDGAWECCGKGSGTFRAVDRLLVGRFLHMPAAGEWTLGVLDDAVDGSNGTMTSWSLDLELRPCDWRSALRWSNVTGSDADRSPPSPRAHHVAAVVDDGLFVAGGTGVSGLLSDLWRRGNASSSSASKGWMLLAVGPGASLMSAGPARPHGANIVVSPWGVLSLGGMLLGTGVGEASNVWVLDPVSKLWHTVPVDHDGEVIGYSRPMGRYHSAVAVVKGSPAHAADGGEEGGGGLILFGGKDDWRRLDDLWRLAIGSLLVTTSQYSGTTQAQKWGQTQEQQSGSSAAAAGSRPHVLGSWSLAEEGRHRRCAHFLAAGTANDTWQASCGEGTDEGGDGGCTMAAVLEAAWCLGEYQGVGSPH